MNTRSARYPLLLAVLAIAIGLSGCNPRPKNITYIPPRSPEPVYIQAPPPITNTPVIVQPPPPVTQPVVTQPVVTQPVITQPPPPVTQPVVIQQPPPIPPGGTGPGTTLQGTDLTPVTPVNPETTGTGGLEAPAIETFEDMTMDRETFQANTVYFEFDKSIVRTADRANVEAVASQLKDKPLNKVLIDGHCDERGTEGYNLSLGERRAQSVREYLANLGIDSSRVRTRSFGEARPAVDGTDDAAYAKNRRAEFILLLPP